MRTRNANHAATGGNFENICSNANAKCKPRCHFSCHSFTILPFLSILKGAREACKDEGTTSDNHEHNSLKTTPLGEENETLTRMRGVTTRCYNGPDKTLVLADVVAGDCWTHGSDMEAGPRWLVQGRRWNCEALVLVLRKKETKLRA
ncbi:hypothetical protein DEO72_LG7g1724 [Vigna unguiculata]|uniref:Uncharacterized protein n=1 Tax=Vigna unguiculata TaxID=3917 RepID=A0A4D6MI26_VIGUN|nr:hypothetical protein DEO72_LG7g1724 [Vigna unguiculata]